MGLRKLFSILSLNDRGLSYAIDKKRKKLSRMLSERAQHTVQYGPFKGMRLSSDHWWGSADRAAMIFGLYEQEVMASVMQTDAHRNVFVDLGAADGYYSIGAVVSGKFSTSYAFEITAAGQKVIAENAKLNGCDQQVRVLGKATADFDQSIPPEVLARAVVLVDVEGAEFDILTRSTLERLKHSVVLIELHDWFFDDGAIKLHRLLKDAEPWFRVSRLTTGARDLSVFPELAELDDSERWLMASEGRNRLMTWLRLDPRA